MTATAAYDDDPHLRDEPGRLAALRRLEVLDTPPEPPFENVVSLVREILRVPIAAVSLIDADRQWFKACSGMSITQTTREESLCTHTVAQRDPMIITDISADPRFADHPIVQGDSDVRSYLGIPLRTADGYNIGSLCAVDTEPRMFSAEDVAVLTRFARIVVDELELRRIAARDQLTGALTRRGFLEAASQERERFSRYGRPASLAIIDLDHFKAINDTYGHPAGDVVLRQVAAVLDVMRRPNDLLGRLGGEEFAMLMPETTRDAALAAAERYRRAIAAAPIEITPGTRLPVTASFGVAQIDPGLASVEDWCAAADAPLYAAKRGGRNRCMAVPLAAQDA